MKKIAVNTIKAFLKERRVKDTYTRTYEVAGNSFEVVFHPNLSIAEKTAFINRVLSGCFDRAGNFLPEYEQPVFRATVLQVCTNVPAITLKNETADSGLPALDLEAMNDLYMAMELDSLDHKEFQSMLTEMETLCSKAVEWKKSSVLHSHDTDPALRNLLDTLTAKVDGIDMESLMRYAGDLSEATKGLGEGDLADKLIELSQFRDRSDG